MTRPISLYKPFIFVKARKRSWRILFEPYVFVWIDTTHLIKTSAKSLAVISSPNWVCLGYPLVKLGWCFLLNSGCLHPSPVTEIAGKADFHEKHANFVT